MGISVTWHIATVGGRRSQLGRFPGSGTIWWGEATDEPARADARPTENANCTTTKKGEMRGKKNRGRICATRRILRNTVRWPAGARVKHGWQAECF